MILSYIQHYLAEGNHTSRCLIPLTPKPAVTGHATSILVGRISAGYCSESGEKAIGRVVVKKPLGVEIRMKGLLFTSSTGETGWTNLFYPSISKRTSVYNCIEILRTLSGQRVKSLSLMWFSLVMLTSRVEAAQGLFWDRSRHFEPRSDVEDDSWAGKPLFKVSDQVEKAILEENFKNSFMI
ncbi:hypothetical protein AVEN_147626-1 [Araneus ventricosus]|uniref:Uncharacterized protein n=1 Tax=Araneus ventricosus TaxID=182803 RepID=A0A4Y2J2U7_ARAVE|nr:hypothetical protein AVEN_11810-1 [Araneus ventricosus]GBM84522.1 hypothetical protein AVEN_41693-1 [Araneus ventricosus]GBM84536.1 hypothetical protein AVEN_135698-1 [Araneus ventricosus]GBM84541.1 hypothetical protein AVEN_147626-1 [Araneus ventricosus]